MKKFCIMLIVFAMVGSATAIVVPDASFEGLADSGDWAYLNDVTSPWYCSSGGSSGTWIGDDYIAGVAYGYPQVGHDGTAYVDMNTYYITQTLSATYLEGETYKLSVWATTGQDDLGQTVWLYISDDVEDLAESGALDIPMSSGGTHDWYQYSLSYTATAADAGKNIVIWFWGDGDTYIDDITLEMPAPRASNPDPWDGETGVPLDKTLSWNTGVDPNSGLLWTGITAHNLYMNDGTDDTNLLYVTTIPASGDTGQYTPGGDWLLRDGTYLWRIDEVEPDAPEPDIIYTGEVWAFEAATSFPTIDTATPADVILDLGETAVFTVSATNPFTFDSTGMTYQWYKVGTPDTAVGTDSTTLTINNVQPVNEGWYYCTVTITSNSKTTDSRTAGLGIKKLFGHWKMDETNGTTASDSAGTADGTLLGGFRFDKNFPGQIGAALNFDGSDDYVSLPALNLVPTTITITAWVKADTTVNNWDGIVHSRGSTIAGLSLAGTELRYNWNDAGDTWEWESGLNVTVGEWTFVAMAIEPDKATLSVNGAFATNTVSHDNLAFDSETRFGCDDNGGTRFFNGGIDDVRIYNYPLDRYAIAQLFIDGKPGEVVCIEYPVYDFDKSCVVDLGDLAELASQWLECNIVPDCLN